MLGVFLLGTGGAVEAARAASGASRARVIRALVESWPPYLIPGADGAMRGLDAELLQAICKQAGYELNWIRGPMQWRKRRFRELQNDQFDVIFSATPTPAHEASVMYTRTYRNEAFMVAAPDPRDHRLEGVQGFEDLLRRRIPLLHVDALSLGADFEAWRQRLGDAGLLIPYPTMRQGVEMLRLNRAPLILGDELDLLAQARSSGVRLARQPYGYSVQPVSLMLSRRRLDEADLARIDQAIHALEQRGSLAAIRRRHGAI
ncbi:transporter substrate-binding domain-containing protein [Mitsuaria sp. GD03876]|uniref:substrate-binding periplasmic protein n=1 Tax=Mitsuaria sp. GD03876 TaxID=2975399 RepID=UPI0024493FCF|nr:transporter substrate-binding domain-containing protein [Mitsuaria sp. GD03876]MDH0864703.1 transporter substrate-binding domain-containing protein [Mitsuaria sp. GD03876]